MCVVPHHFLTNPNVVVGQLCDVMNAVCVDSFKPKLYFLIC